ncbi:MAG: beta-ketoacyl-ACP synthase II [Atribacterota bacterium]|nr:beta-ketoacyl-ACP synthase II [Atribacterota bacterium]MDD4895304.1 beta-ketoacyl-ACP synthase II [Atribacterota bacterium]MDD5636747.1 beta-ketoacyl-ACP synthase II [Atribacterota bacterium]
MRHRVVITGMGAVAPIGNDVPTFWNNIKKGTCGIDFIKSFDTSDFKVKIAAEVKEIEEQNILDYKEAKRMDRYAQMAMIATDEAIRDANLEINSNSENDWGVIIGTGIGGFSTMEKENEKIIRNGPKKVSPLFIPMAISNMASASIAIKYGLRGVCESVVSACASGASAIHYAFRLLQQGIAPVILSGGTEAAITPLALAGFTSMGALYSHNEPKRASIPFDAERSGFVMGEGAGVIVMESLENAQQRGAKIYAELIGCGVTCDAYHITAPDPEGEGGALAMHKAVKEGGIDPSEVSYINAHGTSTPYNDLCETKAIKSVFADSAYTIPISSTKSMTAHMLGAAGAVEAIICIKAMQDSFIPPTIGLEQPDPDCDLDYVPKQGGEKELAYSLSNSFGFGGHNVSLLFKKWQS